MLLESSVQQLAPVVFNCPNRFLVCWGINGKFSPKIAERQAAFFVHANVLQHTSANFFLRRIRSRHQDFFLTQRFSIFFSAFETRMRFTKIPGVWTESGGRSPTSTSSSTSAI